MKTKLYIVRHTQTTGNIDKRLTGRTDYDLTEEGITYADRLTEKLSKVKFDIAYSSTSARTSKTIKKLADLNNLNIIEDEDLCEMNFGAYDGMTWDEVNKINPRVKQIQDKINHICEIPDQESMEDVTKRMYKKMLEIAHENIGKTILICSHGVAIEAFLRQITRIPFSENREEYSQKNTSLNIVEYDDEEGKFEIKVLNDISHLKNIKEKESSSHEER